MVKRAYQSAPSAKRRRRSLGFTLIEMIMVIAIMGILLAMAVPNYRTTVRASQEAVLRDDLFQLRSLIDQYTLDKQEAPQSLDDLVTSGYLRQLPKDPFTQSSSTWQTQNDDTMMSPDQTQSGIVDVHSGASGVGLDGTSYSSW
ncbi:MAG TPA: prepilin-type N-terminal cleavage/methylation domain-containing protein [Terriglobales bacterium]|nr:prepilin-type N-terminal cleavage/methylation domain-containing protein [Terriglobales bacterium]